MIEASYTTSPSAHDDRFQVSIDLMVHDRAQLWATAAAKGCSFTGMEIKDIEDVIGPREDPDVYACLSMLMTPSAIPGCRALDFRISPTVAMPSFGAMDQALAPAAVVRSMNE